MARRCSTICLPSSKDDYPRIVDSPTAFRRWIDQSFRTAPELFPTDFQHGYTLKDRRCSSRLQLRIRRIQLKATKEVFSVRPSHAMPYMTAWTDEVQKPLFLRAFGVPFWALARVFGQHPMYWYRLELALGRNSPALSSVLTAGRTDVPPTESRAMSSLTDFSPPAGPPQELLDRSGRSCWNRIHPTACPANAHRPDGAPAEEVA